MEDYDEIDDILFRHYFQKKYINDNEKILRQINYREKKIHILKEFLYKKLDEFSEGNKKRLLSAGQLVILMKEADKIIRYRKQIQKLLNILYPPKK